VRNAGATATRGWKVQWTGAAGQAISQVWNGTLSSDGSVRTVTNLSYNGALAPNATTTFGFTGTGSGAASAITCTAS
jgi:cellulase/cellobiase CelA1